MSDLPFNRLVNDFGRLLGIPDLQPTREGVCQLVFDAWQSVLLVNVGARGQVLLSCPLEVRQPGGEQLELMARNNFMQAVEGVVLCLGEDGRVHAQLGLRLAECTVERLWAAMQQLMADAGRWQGSLLQAGPGGRQGGRPPPQPLEGRLHSV